MSEEIVINAEKRTVIGKKVKNLRKNGILPGIVFGRHIEPVAISMDARESRYLRYLNPSVLVKVNVDGESHTTLVRDKQFDVILGELIHVDLQAISLTEKIRSSVFIEFVGEAPAVKDFDALLITDAEQVEVEALPQNLPEKITVDISSLVNIGDSILVGSIDFGPDVTPITDLDTTIIIATSTYVAEEEVEDEDLLEDGMVEPELIERGRSEEEED